MVATLFAMPPPVVLLVWPIGFVLCLLIAGLFVNATRTRGKRREQDRRAGLGFMAILCGPPVGAILAWLCNTLGDVHPADVAHTYSLLIAIGSFAGFLAGLAFGITGLICPRDSSRSAVLAKKTSEVREL
jgi:hypothetical protein